MPAIPANIAAPPFPLLLTRQTANEFACIERVAGVLLLRQTSRIPGGRTLGVRYNGRPRGTAGASRLADSRKRPHPRRDAK